MAHNYFVHEINIPIAEAQLTPDDTLIIVDMQYDFLPGGTFAVAGGPTIVPLIANAIEDAHTQGSKVIFTRDYHLLDHISFNTQGGHFPPHCKQGT